MIRVPAGGQKCFPYFLPFKQNVFVNSFNKLFSQKFWYCYQQANVWSVSSNQTSVSFFQVFGTIIVWEICNGLGQYSSLIIAYSLMMYCQIANAQLPSTLIANTVAHWCVPVILAFLLFLFLFKAGRFVKIQIVLHRLSFVAFLCCILFALLALSAKHSSFKYRPYSVVLTLRR